MKSVSDLLHRTPWWALIFAGLAAFAGLAFFATPYHIIQYRDDGKTVEESRAIKREIDNAFAENAINLGRGVVRGMLARTTDPQRREELEQALQGLEEAREELRQAGSEVLRAKREALTAAREATRNVQDAMRNAQREAARVLDGEKNPEAVAALKELQRSLAEAKRHERDAERALRRAERGTTIQIGPSDGKRRIDVQIDLDDAPPAPTPPAEPSKPGTPSSPETPAAPEAGASPEPPAPPIPPELANRIRKGVTGDMYRIGIGAVLIMVLVPLFLVAIVIKFFVDRSRASQRVADVKRKEAEYHRMSQQVTEAKLSALQAQVEPHFLYNTLASVQALTEVDPAKANEMTGHLIQYLRNALPKMRESVSTVGQEVELVRAYLSILQMRMGTRLAFTISVPAELAALPFPPLMLPSLVENAIKHGLEPQREGGSIDVSASLDEGRLKLVVADTGRGFSDTPGAGVGLANIRERLAALYGEGAHLTMEANSPRGVIATIDVPMEGTRSGAGAGFAPSSAGEPPAAGAAAAGAGFASGGTAAGAAAAGAGAFVSPEPPAAPPPSASLEPARSTFWTQAWEVLVKVERGWRFTLYYLFLVMVGVAAVAAIGFFIAAAVGVVPMVFDNEQIAGPLGVVFALAAAVIGFVVVSMALAIVALVLYGLGFFLFGLLVFVLITVLIALSPVLAPFVLLGLFIWWMARRRKAAAPGVAAERVEPTLAK
jgi:signal transduction histidine kinase